MGCFDNIDAFRESKRYLNKDNTVGVRGMYNDLWNNYINMYGVKTTYYRHGYNLQTQDDFIYGEDPTEPFLEPKTINMIVEYQTDALLLSKFGLESTSDLNAVVSIKDYQNVFGLASEPKAGDVLELTEAGWLSSEMPVYDGMLTHFNVIANVDVLDIDVVSGIDVDSTRLAPVKAVVTENVLSYTVPMYTVSGSITGNMYPIENELLELSGAVTSQYYLRMSVKGETYFTPLYTPVQTITMPGINSLYFNYDIVDLNGGDVNSAGFFPFEYNGEPLVMPLYTYATSGEPSATVIISADDLSYMELDAKTLVCKHMVGSDKDYDYVNSVLIELNDVYGAPYIRYPQLFEITEVKYQDFSQQGMNFMQGHYIWQIHAKRFDYSFEPGISSEGNMDQVYDNSFFGTLSSFDQVPSPEKVYTQEIETASKEVWDYTEKGTDTDPYGYY